MTLLLPHAAAPQGEATAFDFETGDLQGWEVVEGQFGRLVCDRKVFHHTGEPYNKQGEFLLSTLETVDYRPNDGFTGVVTSPAFTLTTPRLCFLIGGGGGAGEYLALCLAGEEDEVRAARGDNSQTMRRHMWEVSEFVGRRVFLRLVDKETGGWGHITCDDFRPPTDEEAATLPADASPAPPSPFNLDLRRHCADRLASTRAAVDDLRDTFGPLYPRAGERLQELARLTAELERIGSPGEKARLRALAATVDELCHQALLDNPLLRAQPILYVSRNQYKRDHHNSETMFQNGAVHGGFEGGGALRLLDLSRDGRVQTLLDAPEGMVRDPEVHFDGRRILVSYRRDRADDYHIYELGADGSGPRQLTVGSQVADIDPMYLPNGDIIFASTRDPKVCACNVHRQANLFRMDADGRHLRQVSGNTLFDGHPSLLPDGRVLYSRWEYVDKHFGPAQGLWTMNPDGTNHAVYYGNNAWWPGAILDGRAVPGGELVIATLGSCHAPPFGEIALIDRRVGFDGQEPIVRSWPAGPVSRNGYDHVWELPLRYEDPCPLSDKYFLASRTIGGPEDHYGLYLLDVFGNEVLVHQDSDRGCFDPMPLAPRKRPPTIPDGVAYGSPEGTFFVQDVYSGTGMEAVPRGSVKWLRMVESPPKRFISGGDFENGARQAPAMNWSDVVNKRIIGRVPVAKDGSAHFRAPADRFLFFQLLDEDGMMIQSMRSGTILMPGETRGCVGCHDERNTAALSFRRPQAVAAPPATPEPWYGPPREFSYAAEVQPVLDRYCVSCHDYGKPAGERLNLCGDKTLLFSISYLELRRKSGTNFVPDKPGADKRLIKVVNHGPPEVLPAFSWGSHRSKLVDVIRGGHAHLRLDSESLDRLITWIDLNAVYYGSFACVRPDNLGGRCPLSPAQIAGLKALTGMEVDREVQASYVNLTRPELSYCLRANLSTTAGGLAEPETARYADKSNSQYQEALAIIRAGAVELAARPRMDMPGAVPHESCLRARDETAARRNAEEQARAALRAEAGR